MAERNRSSAGEVALPASGVALSTVALSESGSSPRPINDVSPSQEAAGSFGINAKATIVAGLRQRAAGTTARPAPPRYSRARERILGALGLTAALAACAPGEQPR